MSRAFNNAEFIDSTEMDSNLPRTFSTIVNNDDILQMYLKEIGRKKMLSKNEEVELGRKIQEGSDKRKRVGQEAINSGKFKTCCEHCQKVYRSGGSFYGSCSGGFIRVNKGS